MAALNGRVDASALPLAVGDLLAILGVLTIGMLQHGTLIPGRAAGVYAPFLIGWGVAGFIYLKRQKPRKTESDKSPPD